DYDALIKEKYNESKELTDEIKYLLLQRKFVERVGFHNLQRILNTDAEHYEAITWLFNNLEALELYILGGAIESGGSYTTSMDIFTDLYTKYHADFNDPEHGEFFLKLATSLSLTHAKTVRLWTGNATPSNAVERYEIYKENFLNGRIAQGGDAEVFENLPVELMRWVVNNLIDDEEINWLIDYSLAKKAAGKNHFDAYEYIEYTFDYNYNDEKFYLAQNYEMWNEKYNISDLTGYGETGVHKLWMVFEDGSVCGGLAKVYANLGQVFGRPSAVIGQPGHAAAVAYRQNSEGLGIWAIQNDVSGWTKSEKGERLLLGWGSNKEASYYNVSYIILAQQALNNYDAYIEASYYNFLAETYAQEPEKQVEIYNQALEIQEYNLDSWIGLIKAYENIETKTSADYFALANRVVKALGFFPLPFVDVMNMISLHLTDDTDLVLFDMLKTETLQRATVATEADTTQPRDCITMAKYLLGEHQVELATFSFDGENAGQIVLDEKYENSSIRWEYSLDGWQTSKETDEKVVTLTAEELAQISDEYDIQISLVGTSEIYVIDITQYETPTNLYANDLENQIKGLIAPLEYSEDHGVTWHDYDEVTTRFTGDVTVQVRYKASGTSLASEVAEYTFTEDNQLATRQYIPLEHVSVHMYSSQEASKGQVAQNFIDGNNETVWHNTWSGEELKYFSVELDQVRKLSAIEYQSQSGNGNAKDLDIYTSVDGVNWVKVGEARNLPNDSTLKVIELDQVIPAKYVMLHAVSTHGSPSNKFFTGRVLNLFEDTSVFSFSFDGENAGKIMVDGINVDSSIRWEYSLDGWKTKVETDAKQLTLTTEELAKINENNGIQISIVGSSDIQVININKYDEAPTDLYVNDLENQFRGLIIRPLEYSEDHGGTWHDYDELNTRFTGDVTVQVRYKASGTSLASEVAEYTFTEDNQLATR
ncbi:MAG: discoidin domain-containing protein, partial [Turicibacter sp.]|nr:discoidin domain-containing protein [Turicibacter sp.]